MLVVLLYRCVLGMPCLLLTGDSSTTRVTLLVDESGRYSNCIRLVVIVIPLEECRRLSSVE